MSTTTPTRKIDERELVYKERSIWRDVPIEQWRDWRWQMRNRISTADELARVVRLDDEERAVVERALELFRFALPPYYAALIDPKDPECPIRRQAIPSVHETLRDEYEIVDPLNEEGDSVAPGMTHRYPDRVLWVVIQQCAMFCRHCTRKRKVGEQAKVIDDAAIDRGIAYLNEHPEVRDVLLSGGDPLLLPDEMLDHLLTRIRREAKHVEIVRLGSRTPVVMPQRITPELVAMLAKHHPFFLNTHFNVPRELTAESEHALALLADAGIPLGNQSVLLAGVNDCPVLMRELVYGLTRNRVRPYYVYQCDLAPGLAHFRTTVAKGIEIIESLRGHVSGIAVPTFVVDAPGGGGKIPVQPNYLVSQHEHKVVLRNFEGRIVAYEEPRDYRGMCTEGDPCRHCRKVLEDENQNVIGVAGLFDDDPANIALVPTNDETEVEEEETA